MRRDDCIRHGKRSRHGRHEVEFVAGEIENDRIERAYQCAGIDRDIVRPVSETRPESGKATATAYSRQAPMRAIKRPVFSGFKSSAPFLQPRFRLVAYPVGGIRMVLELIDLFNRPTRPFDLDCPMLTVTKYYEENWLCGRHGEART
jgi:hypothetical protein